MLIFSFPFFFSIVRKVVEEEKRRKKMNTSSRVCVFFCFVMGKSFAMRFCNTVVIVVATTMYIYFFSFIFIHFNCRFDGVYRYAVLFLLLLFFDSIHSLSLSPSFLFCYNPLYSGILLSQCVPYVFFFPS